MRRLLYALLFVLTSAVPASAQGTIVGPGNLVLCPLSVNTLFASATTVQMVAPSAGKSVFICGWHVTSILSTSSTFQIQFGTGATCGTNTVNVTPLFSVTSTAPSADHQSYAFGPNSAVGAGLCVTTAGAPTGTAVMIYSNQF